MFKVNNKNTRMTLLTSFCCFYCWLWTYFTSLPGVCIVDFEQANVRWVMFFSSWISHWYVSVFGNWKGTTNGWNVEILRKAKEENLSLPLEKGKKNRRKYCKKRLMLTLIIPIWSKKHASMLIKKQIQILRIKNIRCKC